MSVVEMMNFAGKVAKQAGTGGRGVVGDLDGPGPPVETWITLPASEGVLLGACDFDAGPGCPVPYGHASERVVGFMFGYRIVYRLTSQFRQ